MSVNGMMFSIIVIIAIYFGFKYKKFFILSIFLLCFLGLFFQTLVFYPIFNSFSLLDLGLFGIFICSVINFLKERRKIDFLGIIIYLSIILHLGLVIYGGVTYGLGTSYGEARGTLYFLIVFSSLRSFLPETKIDFTRLFRNILIIFLSTFAIRFILMFSGIVSVDQWASNESGSNLPRMFNASQAFALLLCTFYFLNLNMKPKLIDKGIIIVSILELFLSQQRTVLLCAITAVAFTYLPSYIKRRPSYFYTLILTSLIIYIFVRIFGINPSIPAISEALSDTSTLNWRSEGWVILINNNNGDLLTKIIGSPYGVGWERILPSLGQITYDPPHNYYIELYLRGGLVSLLLALGVMISTMYKGLYYRPYSRAVVFLVTSMTVYFVTYSPNQSVGLFLGSIFILTSDRKVYSKDSFSEVVKGDSSTRILLQ